ncbi:carboxylesterase [Postechiella marina]|uniref:Carboxylesterase n=1 Tax=Postechiella marina TaxID=943941 RepID=A0ABP8CCC6_9FLAO
MNSYFKNSEVKKEALLLYYSKLNALNIEHQILNIETSFGNTNIIATGNKNNKPLVLVHGTNGCAPLALEAFGNLSNKFRVFAVDVVGQPNLSDENRPDMSGLDYGKWMYEIISRLNIYEVYLVGISFGGFISLKTLVYDDRRIVKAFLIAPAGVINGNPLTTWYSVFLPLKLYKWTKNTKFLNRFLKTLFSYNDAFALKFLALIFLNYNIDFSTIPLITSQDVKKIKTPIYFFTAENDVLFPGGKMEKKVRCIFKSLKNFTVFKNAKHVLSQEDNNKIIEFILKSKLQ